MARRPARARSSTRRGAAIVKPGANRSALNVTEISGTVAIVGEGPLDRLWHAGPAYPTINEVWLRLLEAYGL